MKVLTRNRSLSENLLNIETPTSFMLGDQNAALQHYALEGRRLRTMRNPRKKTYLKEDPVIEGPSVKWPGSHRVIYSRAHQPTSLTKTHEALHGLASG